MLPASFLQSILQNDRDSLRPSTSTWSCPHLQLQRHETSPIQRFQSPFEAFLSTKTLRQSSDFDPQTLRSSVFNRLGSGYGRPFFCPVGLQTFTTVSRFSGPVLHMTRALKISSLSSLSRHLHVPPLPSNQPVLQLNK